jgi:hypothetical protein
MKGLFSLPLHPDHLWGPLSLLSIGYQGLFPKQPQHEADNPSPSSTEVKNAWSYTFEIL